MMQHVRITDIGKVSIVVSINLSSPSPVVAINSAHWHFRSFPLDETVE